MKKLSLTRVGRDTFGQIFGILARLLFARGRLAVAWVLFAACLCGEELSAQTSRDDAAQSQAGNSSVQAEPAASFCGFDKLFQQDLGANPRFANLLIDQNREIQRYIDENPGSLRSNYVVPVVAYIVHKPATPIGTAENITNLVVDSQIYALNQVFNPLGIEFCLAMNQGSSPLPGTPTPGIIRISSTLTNHVLSQEAALKALSPVLPSAKYLRIWVVEDIDDAGHITPNGILGYAHFPGGNPALDGIVIRYDAFGDKNTCGCTPLASYDEGDVLAHEVGHYLNLWHPFDFGCTGNNSYCGAPDDCVADTPPVAQANQGCPPLGSVHSCGGGADLLDNQMDYTNDLCRSTFTPGQAQRMLATLGIARAALVDPTNLAYTNVSACTGGIVLAATANSTNVCTNSPVSFTALGSTSGITHTWTFGDGGTASGSSVSHTYTSVPTSGAYTVTVTATGSGNSLSDSLLVFVTACAPIASTQGNWYFGHYAALNFATGTPVFATDSAMPAIVSGQGWLENCVSQSDSNGNLLFYSDGSTVWTPRPGPTHVVMANGTGLLGSASAQQGVVAIPRPGNPGRYYIFTMRGIEASDPIISNPLRYTEIDMTAIGGSGAVVLKNAVVPLNTGANANWYLTEAVVAAPHCNGQDYWVITRSAPNVASTTPTSFYVTLVGPSGPVSTTAWPTSFSATNNPSYRFACMDISRNGRWLASCVYGDVRIYHFDPNSGAITLYAPQPLDPLLVPAPTGSETYPAPPLSFSPDSTLLYCRSFDSANPTAKRQLVQIEIATLNKRLVAETPSECEEFSYAQLGPDDKLYVAQYCRGVPSYHGYDYLSVINSPNKVNGSSNECGWNPYSVWLGGGLRKSDWGLPNMVDARPPTQTPLNFSAHENPCRVVHFTALACGTTYLWNFGDGSASTQQNPTHTYSASGTYTVALTVGGTTITKTLTVGLAAPQIIGPISICPQCPAQFHAYNVIAPAGVTISWSITGGSISGPVNGVAVQIVWTSLGGALTVTITDPATGCTNTATVAVTPDCCDVPPDCAWHPGSISGVKFQDSNCDGNFDQSLESVISGWTIIAINEATGQQFTTTTTTSYNFANLPLGTYTVLEQQLANWVQSQPSCTARIVNLNCHNLSATGVDFGNCPCTAQDLFLEASGSQGVWQVVGEPPPGSGTLPRPATLVTPNASWCTGCGGTWMSAAAAGNSSLPAGNYTYQFCFCLDPRFQNPQIAMCLVTDDASSVYLNGNLIGTTPGGGTSCTPVGSANALLFRPGLNCVQIVVNNATPGPTGVNVVSSNIAANSGLCCVPICPCVAPPGGMIGWWPMYETTGAVAHDIAGTPQNGLVRNGGALGPVIQAPGNVASLVGAVGQSLCLDGVNDYIEGPGGSSGALNVGLGDFSIDAWIKPANVTGLHHVVDKTVISGPFWIGYSLSVFNGTIRGGLNSPFASTMATGAVVTANTWHHVALTVERWSSTGGKLYVDGIPTTFDPTAAVSTNLNNSAAFRIGAASPGLPAGYFNGCIDEVQFFKRALTAAEVYAIYAAQANGKCREDCKTIPEQGVCLNETTVSVSVVVSNWSSSPQSYVVTPVGLATGTGCTHLTGAFTPPSKTVTVQPYKSLPVTFTTPRPIGWTAAAQTACFEYHVTNTVSGNVMICPSKLYDLHVLCGPPVCSQCVPLWQLPINHTYSMAFSVTNTGAAPGDVPYQICARKLSEDDGRGHEGISLNGQPAGTCVLGTMTLPAVGGPPVAVDVQVMPLSSGSPFDDVGLVLTTDVDHDGAYEPLSAVLVEPQFVNLGDMNCDEQVDTSDIGPFVQALVSPTGYDASQPHCDITNADLNRDGFADGRDCQTLIELLVQP